MRATKMILFNYGFHLLWHTVELAMSIRLCLS